MPVIKLDYIYPRARQYLHVHPTFELGLEISGKCYELWNIYRTLLELSGRLIKPSQNNNTLEYSKNPPRTLEDIVTIQVGRWNERGGIFK